MRPTIHRFICGSLFAALAVALYGCLGHEVETQVCDANYCYYDTQIDVPAFAAQQLTAISRIVPNPIDSSVLDTMIVFPCPCAAPRCNGADSLTLLLPPEQAHGSGELIHYTVLCGDPVLAEWPTNWFVTDFHWSHVDGGNDGTIGRALIGPYKTFPGDGPIVTDPGCTAYVLSFGLTTMPTQSLFLKFMFRFNATREGTLKGLDVATIQTLESNQRFIVPLAPEGLDFTALHAPDPRVFDLGPDVVPTLKKTWGEVKTIYR